MKTLILGAICSLFLFSANAQTLTVINSSSCKINYYLSATDASCSSSISTVNYGILAGTTVTFSFSSASWSGTPPSSGWQWQFIKEWNGCGTYSFPFPSCSGGVNSNVCGVGIPCSGLATASCMKIDMSCNTCNAVKTEWIPTGGGNVTVKIW